MASVSLYLVFSSIQYMVCCNDIHLAKRLRYALLFLAEFLSSLRIGPHIECDKLVSEPLPTLGAPLIDRTWPLLSLEEKTILSLVTYRRVGILFTPYPLRRSGEELSRRCFDSTTLLTQFF